MSISSFRQALLRDIIIGQKKKTTNVLKSTVLRGSVCSEDYSWLWDDEIGCDWYNHAVHKSCTGYNSTMYFFCNGRIFFFFVLSTDMTTLWSSLCMPLKEQRG